jgi:hypothetical protein
MPMVSGQVGFGASRMCVNEQRKWYPMLGDICTRREAECRSDDENVLRDCRRATTSNLIMRQSSTRTRRPGALSAASIQSDRIVR